MLCDLVGSTELSRLLDPEDLREAGHSDRIGSLADKGTPPMA